MNKVKAHITKRTPWDITIQAISKVELTDEEIRALQLDLGYHPSGYGCYDIKRFVIDKHCVTKWNCQGSCD